MDISELPPMKDWPPDTKLYARMEGKGPVFDIVQVESGPDFGSMTFIISLNVIDSLARLA
jgi:hypothetical protein